MEKKLVLKLTNHNVYYLKSDDISYYITIPKNAENIQICLELKSKMANYNLDMNDELWVMENVKNTFSYIDEYNITLVLPILDEEHINVLEKMDTIEFEKIDKLLGDVINSSYTNLKTEGKNIDSTILIVNNERYKAFINWFTVKYKERVTCKNLLEIIREYNVNATSYKKINTPGITYVVGSYNTEVDAPKIVKEEPLIKEQDLIPQTNSGFTSYWLLVTITIIVAGIVAIIAFTMK